MKFWGLLIFVLALAQPVWPEPPAPSSAPASTVPPPPAPEPVISAPNPGLPVASSPLLAPAPDRSVEVSELIAHKQLDAAEKIIAAQLTATPQDPEWITLLAEVRTDQGRAQEAVALLTQANQLGGVTASRALLFAFAASVWGHASLAESEFRIAIQLDPFNAMPHYFLARLLYNQTRFDEAIQESKNAFSLSPGFVRAYENVGLCYEGKHDIEEAEHWYLEAIRQDKNNAQKTEWPALDLAGMLIHEHRLDEAKPYLEQALAINPKNPQSLFQMGLFREKKGDLKGALEAFQGAIQADPHMEDAFYQAGWTSRELGEVDQAKQYFKEFEKIREKTQGLQRSWNGREPSAY